MHWIEFIGKSINGAQSPILKSSFRSFCKQVVQVTWIVQKLHRRLGTNDRRRSIRSIGTSLHNLILNERDSEQLEEAHTLLETSMADFKASISAIVNWDAYLRSKSLQQCLQPILYDRQHREHSLAGKEGLHLPWLNDIVSTWIQTQAADHPQRKVLWLRGGPGTGKSVFAAQLIDRIHDDHAAGTAACNVVAKIFCNGCSPGDVVYSLAYQLAMQFPLVQEHVRQALRQAQLDSVSDMPTLFQRLIVSSLKHANPPRETRCVLVVIDGIDALSAANLRTRRELIGLFAPTSDVVQALPPWMGVLITGRPDDDVLRALQTVHHIDLDGGIHHELLRYEVRSFVQRRLHQLRRRLRCRWSAHAMQAVTSIICHRSKTHLFYLRALSDAACLEALATLDLRVLRRYPSGERSVRDLLHALSYPQPSLDAAAFVSSTTKLHLDVDNLHLLEVLLVAQEPLTVGEARCVLPHVDVPRAAFDLRRLFTVQPPDMVFAPVHRHLLSLVQQHEWAVASGLSLERGHYRVAVALLRRTLRMHPSVADFYDVLNDKHSLARVPWERMVATASAVERRLLRYGLRHAVHHLRRGDAVRNFDRLAFHLLASFPWLMLACDMDLLPCLIAQCGAMRRVYAASDEESGEAEALQRLERVATLLHRSVSKVSASRSLTVAQRRLMLCTQLTALVAVARRSQTTDESEDVLEALGAQARAYVDSRAGWVYESPSPETAAGSSRVCWSIAAAAAQGEKVTALASHGDVCLYGTDAGAIHVCVAATGDEVGVLRGAHTAAVVVLAALSGQRVLSVSRDGLVAVWDVVVDVSGASVRERTPLDDGQAPSCLAACACLRLTADASVETAVAWTTAPGYRIVVGLRDGALRCLSLGLEEATGSDAAASPNDDDAAPAPADGRAATPLHVQLGTFVDWYGLEWQWTQVATVPPSIAAASGKAVLMAVTEEALLVAQGLAVAIYRDRDQLSTAPTATLSLQTALSSAVDAASLPVDASVAAVCSLGSDSAAVAVDRFVCVVALRGAAVLRVLSHHTTPVLSLALLAPELLVSASAAHSMRLWSVRPGDGADGSAVVTHLAVVRGYNSRWVAPCGAASDILAASAAGDIRRVAVAPLLPERPCHSQWDVHVEWLFPLAHGPHRLLCVAKRSSTLALYDVATGQTLGSHRLEPGPFDAAAHLMELCEPSLWGALLLDRGRLRLWRVDGAGHVTMTSVLHPTSERVLCFCGAGQGLEVIAAERPAAASVFVGLEDGSVALWQLTSRGASNGVRCTEQRRWKRSGSPPVQQLWLLSTDERGCTRMVASDAAGLHSFELSATGSSLVPRCSASLGPDARGGRDTSVAVTPERWLRVVPCDSRDDGGGGPTQQLVEWRPFDGDDWQASSLALPKAPSPCRVVGIGYHAAMPDSLLLRYSSSDDRSDDGHGAYVVAASRVSGTSRVLSLDSDCWRTSDWTARTSTLLAPVAAPVHLGGGLSATCVLVLPLAAAEPAEGQQRWRMVVGDVDGHVHFLSKRW
eukprot:gene8029-5778_t